MTSSIINKLKQLARLSGQTTRPSAPQVRKAQKVFCLGVTKTATTSFGVAMKHLGYKTWTWCGESGTFVINWHEERFTARMREVVENFDAFEDLPWPLLYRTLDEMEPNAKFVLTLRKSPAVWLSSMQRHVARKRRWVGRFLVYGSYDPVGDSDTYLRKYMDHEREVREYFSGRPGKLLIFKVEEGDSWQKLCDFLEIEDVPTIPFPHVNPSPTT